MPPSLAESRHRRMARRRVIEDGVERDPRRWPTDGSPRRRDGGRAPGGSTTAGRVSPGGSSTLGMRYRWVFVLLHPSSSSHAVPGKTTSANSRAVSFRKRSWLTTRSVAGETLRQPSRVGVRRQHVGPEEEQHADAAFRERLRDARHLIRDVGPWRPALRHGDVGERLAVAGRAVPGPEAAPRHAEMPRERREAADRARSLPAAAALVHRAPAEENHRRPRRRVAAREGGDPVGGNPGDRRGPRQGRARARARPARRSRRCGARRSRRRGALLSTMTDIIARASAASVPGRIRTTSSERPAASVSRTSIVTTWAPRRRAATRCGPVLGWLARLAPQRRTRPAWAPMSSFVFASSTPVNPRPKPPSPQQIIEGCHH